MKRTILACLLLPFFSHILSAQPAGTGAVSGVVTIRGVPARDVAVFLRPLPGAGPAPPIGGEAASMARVRTDGEGRFRFAGVAAGRHILRVGAPGYIVPGDTQFGVSGRTITVAEGEKVEGVALALVRGGVITGRVTTAEGQPAIEERITITWLDRAGTPAPGPFVGGSFEMYMTDDRGRYRVYGVPEGRYLVSAGVDTRPGSITFNRAQRVYPRTYHSDSGAIAREASQAKIVEVRAGAESDGVDIRLAEQVKTHVVSGRVVNADTGAPVAGLDIWRSSLHPDGRRGGGGSNGERSGPNGEFQLVGVLPGQYEIYGRNSPDSEYYGDPTTIVVADADLQGAEIRMRRGATISGVAVIEGSDDPAARAGLQLFEVRYERAGAPRQPGAVMRGSRFNADGSFRLRGVPPGRISLQLMTIGAVSGLSLSRIEQNGAIVDEAIDVPAGGEVTGVRLIFAYGTLSLRGEVRIVGGALPPGQRIFVVARRPGQSSQLPPAGSAEVDGRGRFLLEHLLPGEYELKIAPLFSPELVPLEPALHRALTGFRQLATLSGGEQPPTTLTVDLTPKEEK